MKRYKNIILLAFLSAGFFANANAQRKLNAGGEKESRQASAAPARGFDRPVSNGSGARTQMRENNRTNERNTSRSFGNPSSNNRITPGNPTTPRVNTVTSRDNTIRTVRERNTTPATIPQRNNPATRVVPQNNTSVVAQRNGNVQSVARNNSYRNNNYTYNNYNRGGNYNRNAYNSSYRNGYNRRYVVMAGPRYSYRPHNSISIYFGGNPYYYNQGLFYGYYSGFYQPIFPPFGIRIASLPFGYSRFYMGVDPYYYYNGIYYRQYDNSNYEVVDAPMGATVSSLPAGAKSVVINGEKLYELNGTYYKEDRNYKGATVYTVVGKNGEVNNSTGNDDNSLQSAPQTFLKDGDIVNQLPEGSKVVNINGEKLYVAPDDTYLKEEANGDSVQYRVVGK